MYYNLKEAVRVRMADSDYVRLVNDVCSDESWGPTGQQMEEVAKIFHCGYTDIMEEVIRRLEKRHKSWRRCYKALLLVDYLARNLQERYVDELRRLLPLLSHISTTFHYKDEKNVDHGLSIRERSKKVAELLKDPEHLANERRITQETQRRVAGGGGGATVGYNDRPQSAQSHTIVSSGGVPGGGHHYGHNNVRSEATSRPSPSYDPYPGGRGPQSTEDADMALARRLQEEEDRRAGRHLQETQLGGQRPPQPQPSRTQQPVRAVSYTPNTTNQEEEDMRLAMELQRQFDDADGTDNTSVAITRAHTTPQKSPQVTPQPQSQPKPIPQPQKKPQADALDDIFGQPSPQTNAATLSRHDDDFDFFSGAPASRPQQPPAAPKQSDPFGDDFFNGPQTSAPSQSNNTWGHSAGVHNPPPRPTTKDPFADLVRVAMAQGTGGAEGNTIQQQHPNTQKSAYDADKRKGDLDDLFN